MFLNNWRHHYLTTGNIKERKNQKYLLINIEI